MRPHIRKVKTKPFWGGFLIQQSTAYVWYLSFTKAFTVVKSFYCYGEVEISKAHVLNSVGNKNEDT